MSRCSSCVPPGRDAPALDLIDLAPEEDGDRPRGNFVRTLSRHHRPPSRLRRRPNGGGSPRVSPETPRALHEQGGGLPLFGRGDPLALQLLLEAEPRVLLVLGLVPEIEAFAEAGVRPDEVEAIR